jgi:putative DNA primase/helicase
MDVLRFIKRGDNPSRAYGRGRVSINLRTGGPLTRDKRDLCEWLERIKALPGFHVEGGEGQVYRAAERFALVAMAGELATEYGITGWEKGAAIAATIKCFKAWTARRDSGAKNGDHQKVLDAVRSFIERHGSSRFLSVAAADPDKPVKCYEQAGWFAEEGTKGTVYLFHAAGMREATKGFDFKYALRVLQEAWAMPPPNPKTGTHSRMRSIDGKKERVYEVRYDKLGEGDEGEEGEEVTRIHPRAADIM